MRFTVRMLRGCAPLCSAAAAPAHTAHLNQPLQDNNLKIENIEKLHDDMSDMLVRGCRAIEKNIHWPGTAGAAGAACTREAASVKPRWHAVCGRAGTHQPDCCTTTSQRCQLWHQSCLAPHQGCILLPPLAAAVPSLQDYHQEIQDVMSTAFGVPEDIDEVCSVCLLLLHHWPTWIVRDLAGVGLAQLSWRPSPPQPASLSACSVAATAGGPDGGAGCAGGRSGHGDSRHRLRARVPAGVGGAAAVSMCHSSAWCERHAHHDTAGCCLADSF